MTTHVPERKKTKKDEKIRGGEKKKKKKLGVWDCPFISPYQSSSPFIIVP